MSLDCTTTAAVSLASVALGSQRTFLSWIKPRTQGTSSLGGVYRHANYRSMLRWNGSARKLEFHSGRSTTGRWSMTTAFTTLTEWHGIVVAYDGTVVGNDPAMYTLNSQGFQALTVGAGLTETVTPSGAETAEPATLTLNLGNGLDVGDGFIGEFACWANKLLTLEEAEAALVGGPLMIPGAYLYWPMDDTGTGQATDYSGNGRNGTISGATRAENPPVRPAMRMG